MVLCPPAPRRLPLVRQLPEPPLEVVEVALDVAHVAEAAVLQRDGWAGAGRSMSTTTNTAPP
jgi:hypothetical protein